MPNQLDLKPTVPEQLALKPIPRSGVCPRCAETVDGPSPFKCSYCGHQFTARALNPRPRVLADAGRSPVRRGYGLRGFGSFSSAQTCRHAEHE